MAALAPIAIGCGSPTAQAAPMDEFENLAALSETTLPQVAAGLNGLSSGVAESLTAVSSSAVTRQVVVGLAGLLEPSFIYPAPALKTVALTIVPLDQFWAFDEVISHESSWRVFAVNPSSGAYGLAQALPAEKMFTAGPDWMFNPVTQLRWAYRYMNERYGSPAAAWAFWQQHHWY